MRRAPTTAPTAMPAFAPVEEEEEAPVWEGEDVRRVVCWEVLDAVDEEEEELEVVVVEEIAVVDEDEDDEEAWAVARALTTLYFDALLSQTAQVWGFAG